VMDAKLVDSLWCPCLCELYPQYRAANPSANAMFVDSKVPSASPSYEPQTDIYHDMTDIP
jgi:hypothetical protein